MTDNLLTRDEAIQAMAKGEKVEVSFRGMDWEQLCWRHFDLNDTTTTFRRPPEPTREAREFWLDPGGYTYYAKPINCGIHVREVLPNEVTLRRMTEDEALEEFQKWRIATKTRYADMACYLAPLRALGLIMEDKQ